MKAGAIGHGCRSQCPGGILATTTIACVSIPTLRPHEIAVAACGIFGMISGAFAFTLAGQAMTEAKEARDVK